MNDWTEGYVSDINYTYGYYNELNPYRAKYNFLRAGYAFPKIKTACELGFGQGVSINVHSAASDIKWYGTDFLPSQVAFARELSPGENSPELFDDSFQEFLERDDLPGFDFIAFHGIWSWISDENRQVIVDFIDKKLNAGGIVYLSYNTMPGWTQMAPVQRLMKEFETRMCSPTKSSKDKVSESLDFINKFTASDPMLTKVNTQIGLRLEQLKSQDPTYLAHEYFNSNWNPMYFTETAELLNGAKLQFVSSAHNYDLLDFLNFLPEQIDFINSIQDTDFKELIKDFMVARQFRRDYWVKGAVPLSKKAIESEVRATKIVLSIVPDQFDFQIKTNNSMNLDKNIYQPVIDFLSDYKVKTIGDLFSFMHSKGFTPQVLSQVINVLFAKETISIVPDSYVQSKVHKRIKAFNNSVLSDEKFDSIKTVSTPLTGGGVSFDPMQLLALKFYTTGNKDKVAIFNNLKNHIKISGQVLNKNGQAITKESDIDQLIQEITEQFFDKILPFAEFLKII